MQHKMYRIIHQYIKEKGISPTYQEVAMRAGLTPQSVDRYVHILQDKGWLLLTNQKLRKLQCLQEMK